MTDARRVQVGTLLAISMASALALTPPATAADYFAPQFSQVGITPEIQDLGQYKAKVAVLDGPANRKHRDLRGQISGVFGFGNGTYTQPDNHGTFVAGIIAARRNGRGIVGAAPFAKVYSYGVFDDYAFVHPQATSYSLQDTAARGVTIANMSYGVPSSGPGQPTPLFAGDDLLGINQVRDSVLAVKSAGNDAERLSSWEIGADAGLALKNLIIVGSVDASNNLSHFSNTPGEACFYNGGICSERNKLKNMTMVAPGENWISTAASGYAIGSGTSFSAPLVAGAAALLQSRWPHLQSDPSATRQILFDSAADLGDPGLDGIFGHGLLNVTAAFAPIGTSSLITRRGRNGLGASGVSGGSGFAGMASSGALVSGFDAFDRDFAYRLSDFVAPERNTLSRRLTAHFDNISADNTAVPVSADLSENLQVRMLVPADTATGEGSRAPFAASEDQVPEWQLTYGAAGAGWLTFGQGEVLGLTGADVENYGVPYVTANTANPILSFAKGGVFGAVGRNIGKFTEVAIGFQQSGESETGAGQYNAQALTFGTVVEPGKGLRLGATATYLSEDAGALGATGSGAFALDADEYATQGLSLTADYDIAPSITISGVYTTAVTTQTTAASAFALDGPLRSEAMALGVAKTGVLRANDRLTLSVSQPLRVAEGSTTLRLGDHFDANGDLVFRDQDVGLEPNGRQIDFQIGYESMNRSGIAFEAGVYFSRDDGHIKGKADAGAVARVSLRF